MLIKQGSTVCIDSTQQILVQAHLVEGLKRLLPFGIEVLSTTFSNAVEAQKTLGSKKLKFLQPATIQKMVPETYNSCILES